MSSSLPKLGERPRGPGKGGNSGSTFLKMTSSFFLNWLKRKQDIEICEGGTGLNLTTPNGVRRVSDSVYLLRAHATQEVEPPEVEVVFVHGLQLFDYRDAYWKTWIARENDEDGNAICWPIAWLGEDFPGARIWSLSYDACAWSTETTGRMDLYLTAEKLVQELVHAKIGQQNCPVVFVCHCLGGLVVKKMVVMAHRKFAKNVKYETFLQNIQGFHYYNTPHRGCKLADWAERFPGMGKLVGELKVINNLVERLNAEFDDIERRDFSKRWSFSVVFGANETSWNGQSGMVVEEASARNSIHNFLSVNADHFDVCKPKSHLYSSCYLHVRRFIEDIIKANKEREVVQFELPRHVQGMEERAMRVELSRHVQGIEWRVSKFMDRPNIVGLSEMGGIGKIVQVPESLGQLSQLSKLHLDECSHLVRLPESMSQLSQLLELRLDGCNSLVQLPNSLGQLSQLSKLYLNGCCSLVYLPNSLGQLSLLSNLDLVQCNSLMQLPESLGQLSQLLELRLDGGCSLVQLPNSLGQLSQLSKLHLNGCGSLMRLPDSLGQLSQLSKLYLSGCDSLEQLPESLGQLSQLIELDLDGCSSLVQLPDSLGELSQLSKLYLSGCDSLEQLPESLGQLSQLLEFRLDGCSSLVQLPKYLGQLSQLSKLNLDGCDSLERLPESLGQLSQLLELRLDGCSSLVQLPESLGQLSQLSKLHLDGCDSLERLPESLGQLSQLLELRLDGCSSLVQLPESLGQLSQLLELRLDGCNSLVQLPESLGQLSQLSKLRLDGATA